jgi:hypothetical protein
MCSQPAFGRTDQIPRLALPQVSEIGLADHAPVHPQTHSACPYFPSINRTMSDIRAVTGKDLE